MTDDEKTPNRSSSVRNGTYVLFVLDLLIWGFLTVRLTPLLLRADRFDILTVAAGLPVIGLIVTAVGPFWLRRNGKVSAAFWLAFFLLLGAAFHFVVFFFILMAITLI